MVKQYMIADIHDKKILKIVLGSQRGGVLGGSWPKILTF
jgi:hypothetical protein